MPNKDRQKRSVRQARARDREAVEAAQAASTPAPKKSSSKPAPTREEIEKKENSLIGRTRRYFHDVRTEMHRVVWPSKTELKNYSVAVVAMLIVFGLVVWAVDTGFVALLIGFTGLRDTLFPAAESTVSLITLLIGFLG